MSPLPKIQPAQVKVLVGTWTNDGKNSLKDYFVFKADGTGSWMMQGKPLWSGSVIPAGKSTFRLSWQGKDPNVSTFWAIKVGSDGKLVFQGNQQTYAKGAAAKATPTATGKATGKGKT
jgi:hypothetical protein